MFASIPSYNTLLILADSLFAEFCYRFDSVANGYLIPISFKSWNRSKTRDLYVRRTSTLPKFAFLLKVLIWHRFEPNFSYPNLYNAPFID